MNKMSYPFNISLPSNIEKAFRILDSASYIRPFASTTPLAPDTVYCLFSDKNDVLYVLVATDHVDTPHQNNELNRLSGKLEIEFNRFIKPYKNNEFITVNTADEESFSVNNPDSYWKYYLAEVKIRNKI